MEKKMKINNSNKSLPGGFGDHEGEDTIRIDFDSIPKHVKEDLAATTLECVHNFLRQPGGREFLDAKIAAKRNKGKADGEIESF